MVEAREPDARVHCAIDTLWFSLILDSDNSHGATRSAERDNEDPNHSNYDRNYGCMSQFRDGLFGRDVFSLPIGIAVFISEDTGPTARSGPRIYLGQPFSVAV